MEEFDLEAAIWCIRAERMKKRKAHVIPLPRQAVDLLRTMQGVTGHYAHLFPNRNAHAKPMSGRSDAAGAQVSWLVW